MNEHVPHVDTDVRYHVSGSWPFLAMDELMAESCNFSVGMHAIVHRSGAWIRSEGLLRISYSPFPFIAHVVDRSQTISSLSRKRGSSGYVRLLRPRFCQSSNNTLAEKPAFCYADLSKPGLNQDGNLVASWLSRATEYGGNTEVFQAGSCPWHPRRCQRCLE
jgi:hypothetical protein